MIMFTVDMTKFFIWNLYKKKEQNKSYTYSFQLNSLIGNTYRNISFKRVLAKSLDGYFRNKQ